MVSILGNRSAGRSRASGTARSRLLLVMIRKTPAWMVLLAVASMTSACAATLLPAALGRSIDAILAATGRTGAARVWTWVAGCAALTVVIACADAFVQLG